MLYLAQVRVLFATPSLTWAKDGRNWLCEKKIPSYVRFVMSSEMWINCSCPVLVLVDGLNPGVLTKEPGTIG